MPKPHAVRRVLALHHHLTQPVLAATLGFIHEQIRRTDHFVHGGRRRQIGYHADTETHGPAALHLTGQQPAKLRRNRRGRPGVSLRQQQGKFIATQTGYHVALPKVIPQRPCHLPKEAIPLAVPLSVVDDLEVIDIQVDEGERAEIPSRPPDLVSGQFVETSPVCNTGQVVCPGQLLLMIEPALEGRNHQSGKEVQAEFYAVVPDDREGGFVISPAGHIGSQPGNRTGNRHQNRPNSSGVPRCQHHRNKIKCRERIFRTGYAVDNPNHGHENQAQEQCNRRINFLVSAQKVKNRGQRDTPNG